MHLVLDLVNNFGDWASVTGIIIRRTLGEGERPRMAPRKCASADDDLGFRARRNRSGVLKNFLFSSAKDTNLGFFRVDPAGHRRCTIRAACSLEIWRKINMIISQYKESQRSFLLIAQLPTVPSHYSKSQIFVQKFNFYKTPTFSRVFHSIFF